VETGFSGSLTALLGTFFAAAVPVDGGWVPPERSAITSAGEPADFPSARRSGR
jgi:hypothetical protein